MKKFAVYDIEVFINAFICCVKVLGDKNYVFEISERRNDYKDMIDFFTSDKYVFVGYNCSHYDTPIINALIIQSNLFNSKAYNSITFFAKNLSDKILTNETGMNLGKYKYANFFTQIDLMTLMASKALRVGLKSLQVTMCYPNVKELIIDWNKPVLLKELDDTIKYCINDVDSTSKLLTLLKGDISLRKSATEEFDIFCLSKDGVGVGVDIFTNFVCAELGVTNQELYNYVEVDKIIPVKDLIVPQVKFKTKQFQQVLDWYNDIILDLDQYELLTDKEKENLYKFSVLYNNLSHAYGFGGMHSQNTPKIHEADSEYYLSDEDVNSSVLTL